MNKWMNRRWAGKLAIGAMTVMLCLPALAQEDELKNLPGYVDFGTLDEIYGEPKVMINIGGILLQFAAMAAQDEPETAEMLKGLDGVRINIYSTEGLVAPALEQVENVKSTLKAANWEPVVQVNEQDEQVQIFMKLDGEGMQGMTIMVVNEEEAVFLNILGEIDPTKVGKVMDAFDVDMD